MNHYFYGSSIKNFINDDINKILGLLTEASNFDIICLQRNAWIKEINILKTILDSQNGQIFFEYDIPRLGKRIDVVLLINGIIFVLEFKINAKKYLCQDIEQVWDYALDLKNFHENSYNSIIVPILIATDAQEYQKNQEFSISKDNVFKPILCNLDNLKDIIIKISDNYSNNIDLNNWAKSRYMPTPTIIQAASSLYLNHSIENITRSEASSENLKKTTEFITKIIENSHKNKEKSICFVTGVPGAGKTLIGLNIVIQQFQQNNLAIYLSGNQPLVDVLSEALARNKKEKEGKNYRLNEARHNVKSFIQIIHRYRKVLLNKLKNPIQNNTLEIDSKKIINHKDDGYSEVEHIAIFDEAQRAWTKQQFSKWLKQKHGIQDFPMSEPEFLIWSLNLHKDWAVIICLVGDGQEISVGEAGIIGWLKAINNNFSDWKVYISEQLFEKKYAKEQLNSLLNINFIKDNRLHLSVSTRSFRAEQLSNFINAVLDNNLQKAKILYSLISKNIQYF